MTLGLAGCQIPDENLDDPGAVAVTTDRFQQARTLRESLADQIRADAMEHGTNGDEQRYDGYITNFGKALPHNDLGEHDPAAYETVVNALNGDADFADIPLGTGRPLANPQAARDFTSIGADTRQHATPPAPAFGSTEAAGEMVELY
jgi:hypothetical protein